MNDPMILSGISQLVNKNKINENLDLEAIERDLTKMKKIKSPVKKNFKVINKNSSSESSISGASSSCEVSECSSNSSYDETESGSDGSDEFSDDSDSESDENSDDSESESEEEKPRKRTRDVSKTRIKKTHSITPRGRSFSRRRERSASKKKSWKPMDNNYTPRLSPRSNMQQQDLREEQKETMIADIDWLIDELAQDEIDVSRVPAVNSDSSFKEVERVYKLVKNKYSRSRCDDLSKEIAIAGAKALEMFFDGKKTYFGYKPDMTGWHRTVRTKMRRMNFERTQIVNSFLESNNISPVGRIAMELVPSAFLYSLSRREQFGQNNYTAGGDQGEALNDLRDLD